MKVYNLLLLMSIFIVPVAGNATGDDHSAIRAVSEAIAARISAGNPAPTSGLYTPDAVMLPPSSEILSGERAIGDYWAGLSDAGVDRYAVYTVNLSIDGSLAYVTAIWEAERRGTTGGDMIIRMSGNISNVLQKQADGSWKISLQSWN